MSCMLPNGADRISDWTVLAPGDEVFLAGNNAFAFSGSVDAVTEDGAILWQHLEDGAGRRLFMRGEGNEVWQLRPPTQSQ